MYNYSCISSRSKYIMLTSGRSGSGLIFRSLMDAGANITLEPLNTNFNSCEDILGFDKKTIPKLGGIGRMNIIKKVLDKYDMCKILYYQTCKDEISHLLKEKDYKVLLLLRNPFDVFISFKIAHLLNKWYNFGEEAIIPKEKIYIQKWEMYDNVGQYLYTNCEYMSIADEVFYYEDIQDWDNLMYRFCKLLDFNPSMKINKSIVKNPEKPEDFIENYTELKNEFSNFYKRLVHVSY